MAGGGARGDGRSVSRWSRIADLLREAATGAPVAVGVCRVAAEVLGVERAAIVLITDGTPSGTVGTDAAAAALLAEEFVLGEGPAVAAHAEGLPVLATDVAGADAVRWPAYADAAADAGVGAAHAFPLRIGAARLGVLVGLGDRPGMLRPAAYADALVVAELAAQALLDERAVGPGGVPASFAAGGAELDLVQQASGMVAELAGVTLGDALVRIRAHAYAEDVTVADVARRIVAGTLELEG